MSSGRDPGVDQAPERGSENHNGERRGFRRTQAEMEDFMSKRQKRSLFSMSGSLAEGKDEDFYRRKSNEDEDAMSRVTFIPTLPRSSSGANDDNPTDLSINKNGGGRNGDVKHLSPLRRLHLPSSLTITAASSSGSSGIPAEFAGPSFEESHQDLCPPGDYERSSLTISSNKRLEHIPYSIFHDRNSAVVRPMSPSLSSAERKLLEKEDLIVERIDTSNECSINPGPSANIQDVKRELADSPLTHVSSSISSLVTDLSPRVQPSTSFLPHMTTKLPPIHHEALLKSCEFCTQNFEYETELADHVNRFHQGVKKYFCFICHKRFKRKQSLENHVNMIHSGNRGS